MQKKKSVFNDLIESINEAVKISNCEIKDYKKTIYKKNEKTGVYEKLILSDIK